MSEFDKNEKAIYDALSQITVDASKIKGKVKSQLHEETFRTSVPRRARWGRSMVAGVALSAILFVTAAAAALGGFDWFIEKFNPSFGEIIEPVEISCIDQGIRMEVIGAQKYGNKAIVYLSLQDISGQNRLTEQTNFQDGFGLTMNHQNQDKNKEETDEVASFSWKEKLLFFDEVTNTLYYEFNITADAGSPLADPLELGSYLIYFSKKGYEEPISVPLTCLDDAAFIPINEKQIWGGTNVPDDLNGITVALKPGNYANLTDDIDDQWISNVGIVDGKLHVQIGKDINKEFGSTDATLALKTSDGNIIEPDYELTFLGDKNHHLLNTGTGDYGDSIYKYEESVFSVNSDEFNNSILYYSCTVYSGVEGRWKVAANLSDSSRQMHIWTNDIVVDGHLFEYLTLSPLGLEVKGRYDGEECLASEMSLALETPDGLIPLQSGGGSQKEHTFNSSWDIGTPLEITKVTAVIINGTHIPVK